MIHIMRRRVLSWLASAAVAGVAFAALPGSAAGAPSCVATAQATVCTFGYTGAAESWSVPGAATHVLFTAAGAQGGANSPRALGTGAAGGSTTAAFAVSPGQTFEVAVGGAGGSVGCGSGGGGGGFNGGGGGGAGTCGAGGGGGASDVRAGSCAASLSCGLVDRILVGGGGGGSGASCVGCDGGGGAGGGTTGSAGSNGCSNGGSGGTQAAEGNGGAGGSGGGNGSDGSLGLGGAGGSVPTSSLTFGGGGGGGGYYGGGGAGGNNGACGAAGGGGGSGYVSSGLSPTLTSSATGSQGGNGAVTVMVGDVTAPTTTTTVTPAPGGSGWLMSVAHVTVSATDTGGFGVIATRCALDPASVPASFADLPSSCSYTGGGADVTTSGQHTLYAASEDGAENTGSPVVAAFKIDRTAPSITFDHQSPAANANGWNNSNVTVTWNCADALSGPASPTATDLVTGEGASLTAHGSCTDNAGNSASDTHTVKIDRTAPSIGFSGNRAYALNETVDLTCSASDPLSGIAASTCPGPLAAGPASSFAPGIHTVTATATDKAGNGTGTVSATYSVVATTSSLCDLTKQYSSKTKVAKDLCGKLKLARGKEKGRWLTAYRQIVASQAGHAFTLEEANTLITFARSL
jgi:hypothetical protein